MNMKKEVLSSSLFVLETKENAKVSPNRFSGPGGFPYNPKQKVIVKSRLPYKLKRKTRDKLTHLSLDKVDKIFAEDAKFISSKPLTETLIKNSPNELITSIDSTFSSKIDLTRGYDIGSDDQELDNFSDHKVVSDQDLIKEWLAEGGSEICYSRAGRIYKNATISEKSKANKSHFTKSKRSILEEEKLSCSSEFLSLSRWKAASINPSLQLYFLKAIKFVLLRENAINDLTDTLRELDTHYWKYCCVRIYAITNKLPTLQNQLVQRLQYLTFLHDKVSVAIAHYRSLTIKSIESIISWREKCHLLIDTDEEVTLQWKGESYLLKIFNDSQSFSKYFSIKTWLGFSPNIFFIPPSISAPPSSEKNDGYTPKHIWETTRLDLYRDWIRRSNAHLKHKTKAKQILSYSLNSNRTITQTIGGIGTTMVSESYPQVELSQLSSTSSNPTRQSSIVFQDTQFRRQSKFHMSEEEEAEQSQSQSDEVLRSRSRRSSMIASSSYTNGSKSLPIEYNASIFANAVGLDSYFTPYAVDLMDIKASVIQSQISMDSTSVRPRGSWDLSSTTSACQTVSDIQSLPSLPIEMMIKEIENGWKELQDISMGSWDASDESIFWKDLLLKPQVVEAAVGYRECFPVRDFVPHLPESLVLRCKRLESVVMKERVLIADFQTKVQESEELKMEVGNTVTVENLQQISEDIHNEKFHESSILLKNRQCQSLPSLPLANPSLISVSQSQQTLAPMNHKSSVFLTATSLPETTPTSRLLSPLKINSDRLEMLVKRVQKRRQLTARTELGLKVKEDAPVRQRASSQGMIADRTAMRKMQKITKAFIERRRSCKMAEVINIVTSVVTMQRVYRGWKGRTLAKMRRKIFRRDIFVLRKYVLRVQRASLVIQRFMRWAYYVYQHANTMRPLQHTSSMIRRAMVKNARNKLNQAATTIQVAWRYQVGLVARRVRYIMQSMKATLIQMAFRRFITNQRIAKRRVKLRKEKSFFSVSRSVSRKFGHRFSMDDEVSALSIAVRLGRSRNSTPRNSIPNIIPPPIPMLPSLSTNTILPAVLSPLTTTAVTVTSPQSPSESKLPLTPTSNAGMVSSVSAWSSSTRNRIDAVIRENKNKRRSPLNKKKKSDSTSISSSNDAPESNGGVGDNEKLFNYPITRRSNDAYISPAIKCRMKKENEGNKELDDLSIFTLRVEKSKKDILKSVLKAAINGEN